MIIKELLAVIAAGGIGLGCCIGGISNAYDSMLYENAINSHDFLYLVDEAGNPVSQVSD